MSDENRNEKSFGEEMYDEVMDGEEKKSDSGIAEPDDRFFLDEPKEGEKEEGKEDEEKKEKAFGKRFKKQIAKEKRLKRFYTIRSSFSKFFKPSIQETKKGVEATPSKFQRMVFDILRLFDYALNSFTLLSLIAGIIYGLYYIRVGEPMMVLVICVFIFIISYINEKIT
jgi:hypothetical protein